MEDTLKGMSARTLQIATDVLNSLDVGEAARKNSAEPQAVRQQVEKLQRALGTDLLLRVDGKLGLTEPGRKAAKLAREILVLLERLENLKTELLTSREIVGVAPDIFAALQQSSGGRKPAIQQRRVVLDTSANLKRRFEEKMIGMTVRYIHDYEAVDNDLLTVPLVWAIGRDAAQRPQKRHDLVQLDLPPRDHPIHRAAMMTLRKASIPFTIMREQPEGVYLPMQADTPDGPTHVLVPEFQLERLKLVPTTYPMLQEPLCIHIGIFSHREFFAASDVEAFGASIDAAVTSLCVKYMRGCMEARERLSRSVRSSTPAPATAQEI